jgi:hypothetical protein
LPSVIDFREVDELRDELPSSCINSYASALKHQEWEEGLKEESGEGL